MKSHDDRDKVCVSKPQAPSVGLLYFQHIDTMPRCEFLERVCKPFGHDVKGVTVAKNPRRGARPWGAAHRDFAQIRRVAIGCICNEMRCQYVDLVAKSPESRYEFGGIGHNTVRDRTRWPRWNVEGNLHRSDISGEAGGCSEASKATRASRPGRG